MFRTLSREAWISSGWVWHHHEERMIARSCPAYRSRARLRCQACPRCIPVSSWRRTDKVSPVHATRTVSADHVDHRWNLAAYPKDYVVHHTRTPTSQRRWETILVIRFQLIEAFPTFSASRAGKAQLPLSTGRRRMADSIIFHEQRRKSLRRGVAYW